MMLCRCLAVRAAAGLVLLLTTACGSGSTSGADDGGDFVDADAEVTDVPPDVPLDGRDDIDSTETDGEGEAEADAAEDADATEDGDVPDVPPLECPGNGLIDLRIGDTTGDQVVPKVSVTADRHAWVSWYSNPAGNYNVRLQQIDLAGLPRFGPEGLLVSDAPSDTWVTEHSLETASDGAALVAFNDIRSGNFDVFAYKVSLSGDMLWPADGVRLSDSTDDDIFPRIAPLAGGGAVFAWERIGNEGTENRVVLQRVEADGTLSWGDGIVIEGRAGPHAVYPGLVPSLDDTVLVTWQDTPDVMVDERALFSRRLDAAGAEVWGWDRVLSAGQIMPFFHRPKTIADGDGGAVVVWTALPDGVRAKTYIQHVDRDGALTMPENGAELSTSVTTQQFLPGAAVVGPERELLAAWREAAMGEVTSGIRAQRLTWAGERLWGDEGQELVPSTGDLTTTFGVGPTTDGIAVFSYDYPGGDPMTTRMMGGQLTGLEPPSGWESRMLSDFASGKSHPDLDGDPECGYWVVWDDQRDDGGDVRASFFGLR